MKLILNLAITLVLLSACNSFDYDHVDEDKEVGVPVSEIQSIIPCPDCLETNCIYQYIDTHAYCDGTDDQLKVSILTILKTKSIPNPNDIDNILSNYGLVDKN